ncbi:hypothetical protein NDU88_006856 [Pleurodeles waltl]|uniref:Uncharacterized protein n=1 Tax=Pleurodeles waltl TaxID=8319 RepID=A0AAV7VQB1_PLEWA|nr:hypothetical protein NDU88_006856 [Pleurodeles waltl]
MQEGRRAERGHLSGCHRAIGWRDNKNPGGRHKQYGGCLQGLRDARRDSLGSGELVSCGAWTRDQSAPGGLGGSSGGPPCPAEREGCAGAGAWPPASSGAWRRDSGTITVRCGPPLLGSRSDPESGAGSKMTVPSGGGWALVTAVAPPPAAEKKGRG